MKRTMQKTLAVLLTALLLLTQLAIPTAAEHDAGNATRFDFSDDGIGVTEGAYTGYKIEGTALTLNASGTYTVSGSCADGSIKIKKGTTGVTLILDGLTLTSADTAPIVCNKSTEVTIVAAAGSVNTLTDSARNNDETNPDNENAENAVIKTKDGSRVTLCGTGTVNVIANGKNGVKGGATTEEEGKASLTIRDLTLNITATVNDALKSDQELNLLSGNLTISAADDAIKSDLVLNIGATGTAGPTILITDCCEGIEGATVNIYSGTITLHAEDDGINAANSDLTGYSYACNIYGGTLYLDVSGGDAIDSNGSLTITGGTVEVHSSAVGKDGSPLDCDGAMTISGGTVLAVGNSGMAQTPTGSAQTNVVFGASGGMGGMRGFGGRSGRGFRDMGFGMQMTPDMADGSGAAVSIPAGSTIAIQNASGDTLCSTKALRTANYVFFSSDVLTAGETYTLMLNGSAAATATAVSSGNGGGQPGSLPVAPSDSTGGNAFGGSAGSYTPIVSEDPAEGKGEAVSFRDVEQSAYYYDAVLWGVNQGITTGTGKDSFDPNKNCTRAQVVTFLWRAAGCPEPTAEQDFTDVSPDSYYAKAVAWAAENGITTGTGEKRFSPDDVITRAQAVTFLYRFKKAEAQGNNPFRDVAEDAYYRNAVVWAAEKGVTNGLSGSAFAPANACTRAQILTFLYRDMGT